MQRYLVLEDGTYFEGEAIGSSDYRVGELVFNTGMSGYQEVVSDPSYYGQIITYAFPLVGNYGTNLDFNESLTCYAFGVVVNEMEESDFGNFEEYLKIQKVAGIKGIDTRMLVRKIRQNGVIKASFCDSLEEITPLIKRLKDYVWHDDAVKQVSVKKPYLIPNHEHRIGLVDFGVKTNIVRELNKLGCEIYVLPATTTIEQIKNLGLDGIVLSNGPGDPKTNTDAIKMVSQLDFLPVFGICLGHQIIALAFNGDTEKLVFGHRGINHPVINLETNRVEITSQNHGYAVVESSIEENFTVSHRSLNDRSIEGIKHRSLPIFSVQYHPESSPGPHDSHYLFHDFIALVKEFNNGKV